MLYVSNIVYYKRRGFTMPTRSWSMFNRWLRALTSVVVSDNFPHWVRCWNLGAGNAGYIQLRKNGSYKITAGVDYILALADHYEVSVHVVAAFAYNYFINFVLDNKQK